MTRARYYEATTEDTVEATIGSQWALPDLVRAILGRASGRGHPAAELISDDGATLSLGTDGERAVLVWVDHEGSSLSSVGATSCPVFVYDYFGSWTEAPPDAQVPLPHAVLAMEQFVLTGSPTTTDVTFRAD